MAESIVKAYVLVEYIADGREERGSKTFNGYKFNPQNNWSCMVDNNTASEMSKFPKVFHFHLDPPEGGNIGLSDRLAKIESRLDALEEKPKRGRPAKDE